MICSQFFKVCLCYQFIFPLSFTQEMCNLHLPYNFKANGRLISFSQVYTNQCIYFNGMGLHFGCFLVLLRIYGIVMIHWCKMVIVIIRDFTHLQRKPTWTHFFFYFKVTIYTCTPSPKLNTILLDSLSFIFALLKLSDSALHTLKCSSTL